MKMNITNKVSSVFNKPNGREKSKEKSKKVFHMIFLGASTWCMQYKSREAIDPLK